jgi:hypothetical protein
VVTIDTTIAAACKKAIVASQDRLAYPKLEQTTVELQADNYGR